MPITITSFYTSGQNMIKHFIMKIFDTQYRIKYIEYKYRLNVD